LSYGEKIKMQNMMRFIIPHITFVISKSGNHVTSLHSSQIKYSNLPFYILYNNIPLEIALLHYVHYPLLSLDPG
ncbi:unnamed protein product, partial [marine sediment metagenome]